MSDPSGQQPGSQQPGFEQPTVQQPVYQQPGYQQLGYQQPAYPQYGYPQYGYPHSRPPMPGTLTAAVVLMFVGGGLETLGFVLDVVSGNVSGATVFGAALGAGLWFLMATMSRQGKNWARVTGTVLFGISCLLLLVVLAAVSKLVGPHNSGAAALVVGAAATQWLIGLGAVILLWVKPSSAYFRAMSGPL